MNSKKISLILIAAISILTYMFFSFEEESNIRQVSVVHFEHGKTCLKTCVTDNKIYYIEDGIMKMEKVGRNEYYVGANVEVGEISSGIGYLMSAIFLTLILLPVSFFAIESITTKKGR